VNNPFSSYKIKFVRNHVVKSRNISVINKMFNLSREEELFNGVHKNIIDSPHTLMV